LRVSTTTVKIRHPHAADPALRDEILAYAKQLRANPGQPAVAPPDLQNVRDLQGKMNRAMKGKL
jgi:hypothetical protein